MSNLSLANPFLPRDGSLNVYLKGVGKVTLRLSIMPTVWGEKVVIRLPRITHNFVLDNLGLSNQTVWFLRRTIAQKGGVILICGATGSGKSTTYYSLLKECLSYGQVVSSLEDPVEVEIKGAAQTTLSSKTGLTFSSAVKAVLRQDPEVICISEIRDKESAAYLFQLALTGHLVITTMHAGNFADALMRLEAFGINNSLLKALKVILVQRLLPALEECCKTLNQEESSKFGFSVYSQPGCKVCQSLNLTRSVLAEECLVFKKPLISFLTTERLNSDNNWWFLPFSSSMLSLLREQKISLETYLSYSS
ncbi:MAG: hypothetical protein D6780_04255 [Candidatus Dadabacteria bacterium]|nr:MAG: hypothetical protein D6780_04255 [Candidatus Dadabacteria bacterium]